MEERKTLLKRIAIQAFDEADMSLDKFLFDSVLVKDHNNLKLLYKI
jgi:hypothetical protein